MARRLIPHEPTPEQWQLVVDNLRVIDKMSLKYWQKWRTIGEMLEPGDAVTLGRMGAAKAACKWDPSRGIPYLTYAWWWARQSIQLYGQREVYGVWHGRHYKRQDGGRAAPISRLRLGASGGVISHGQDGDERDAWSPGGLATHDAERLLPDIRRYLLPAEWRTAVLLSRGHTMHDIARHHLWQEGSRRAGSQIGRVVSRERVRQYSNGVRWVLGYHDGRLSPDELEVVRYVLGWSDKRRQRGRSAALLWSRLREQWPNIKITEEAIDALRRYRDIAGEPAGASAMLSTL